MGQKHNSSLGWDRGKFRCATCWKCCGGDFARANHCSQHVVIAVASALCCLLCTKQDAARPLLQEAGWNRASSSMSPIPSSGTLAVWRWESATSQRWDSAGVGQEVFWPPWSPTDRKLTDRDHQLQVAHGRGKELRTAECFNSGCIFYSVRSENLITGLHPVMLSKAFISQSYKLAHSDFGDTWKEAGCTEQSSFFPGQDVNLWKCLFCDSGIRNTQAGMAAVPVLALISALCMCP